MHGVVPQVRSSKLAQSRQPVENPVRKVLGEGKGVVFKAGPGPLAEVGRLGVKGKTPCDGCECIRPPRVCELLKELEKQKQGKN